MSVKLGIDRINEYKHIFENKRIGLITNPTGVNSEMISSIDILKQLSNLVALYSPEHGVRGNIQAGMKLDAYIDEKTNCKVHSLYGTTKKPTEEMLKDIDILCIDIQDIGSRFYTFIYTMAYAMQACQEFNKEFVVFDRPNPINGLDVEGNQLDINFKSFIGLYPITQRYGLTIGELANLFNEEYQINCKLTVIPMENYNRSMYYDETGLNFWIMPSPNIPTLDTAIVYNGTCIFEGTNVSEGRGTTKPFEIVGAPFIKGDELANYLNKLNLPGVHFSEIFFTPTFSKHAKKLCGGVQLHLNNRKIFKPVQTGITMLYAIKGLYNEHFSYNKPYKEGMHPMIDLNCGTDVVSNNIYGLEELLKLWKYDTINFGKIKQKYHIYE